MSHPKRKVQETEMRMNSDLRGGRNNLRVVADLE